MQAPGLAYFLAKGLALTNQPCLTWDSDLALAEP